MSDENIQELTPSELGTKEYWENSYEREIHNYLDHGDVGEVWFDEDSQLRIINWILRNDAITSENTIIDLGSGNGMFLVELAREGYKNLFGVDYSPKAIDLSKSIARDQNLDITYSVTDLLNSEDSRKLGKFDIVHDKGTYDAISLNPDDSKEKRELYINNIYEIQKPEGFFIITSCNWTEEELVQSFNGKFKIYCAIPTPTFKFGGKVGSVVTSLVFKKV